MATQANVRRIALSLPGAQEEPGFSFSLGGKGFAWLWRERVDPKKARIPNPDVLAVRVANELETRLSFRWIPPSSSPSRITTATRLS